MLVFLLSLFPMVIYFLLKGKKAIHMLQQNYYDESYRFIRWMFKNPYKIFLEIDMFFVAFVLCLFLDFSFAAIFFGAFYFICITLNIQNGRKEQNKIPLKITSRVKRLFGMMLLVLFIPIIVIMLTFDSQYIAYYYLLIGAMVWLIYFVTFIANRLCMPIEYQVHLHYRRMAIKKMDGIAGLKKIGITGSYGKTSSKNILHEILNVRFNSFASPKNYNTPIGLILSVNNYMDKFAEVFIAEMGAFKIGEIKKTCDFINPQYGILTIIGTAHLESFGSRENIQKGKFELIESLPADGAGILNGDDPYQLSYDIKSKCKKIWIGIDNDNVDVHARNITLDSEGMTFDVLFKGDSKPYKFETKLLGNSNIYNILAAIALGRHFGMDISDIQKGVKKVKATEHRMELKKMGDITIIDDAYNSNPVGSKMALDVLKIMPGKKIVVTPGMIELGDEEYELNMKFGEYISEVADEVILVGEQITKPIYDGLSRRDFDNDKIHIINDVKVAFSLLQKLKAENTYVLLENDLPDIFNEK